MTPRWLPSEDRARQIHEERMQFIRLRDGGGASEREALVRRFLPLARNLAYRYRASDEPLEDLVQVACIGLLNAVDRFDPARGTAFSTFAVPTILGELRRHFRDRTWTLRVPRDLQELYLKLEHARDDLAGGLHRQPTVPELAERLDVPEERIVEALDLEGAYRVLPLEPADDGDGDGGGIRAAALDGGYDQAEHRAQLRTLMPALDERQARIVWLRFHEDLTQDEIARRVGVSQMQVSRILHRSLGRLREAAPTVAVSEPS